MGQDRFELLQVPVPYSAAMQAAPVSVSICKKCGVVAPARGTACDVCRQPLQTVRTPAPALPGDQSWVALRCGFRSQAHFTTVFRRFVGDTPYRWRSKVAVTG